MINLILLACFPAGMLGFAVLAVTVDNRLVARDNALEAAWREGTLLPVEPEPAPAPPVAVPVPVAEAAPLEEEVA